MNPIIKKIIVVAGVVGVILLAVWLVWYFFFSHGPGAPTQTSVPFGTSGGGTTDLGGGVPASQSSGGPGVVPAQSTKQKIFKIADGPVAGATFIQTQNPTTTIARWAMADNGHMFDLPVDTPGAVARAVSNTTIPGLAAALWGALGSVVVLEYLDGQVVKTVYVGLPATSSLQTAAHIQFLPDNITSVVLSPDGKNILYLLASAGGTSAFVANADGSNQKKLFSLPLAQLVVSWPSPNVLLVQTKAAAGVPGMIFSVPVKTGVAEPLVYAPGITALGNPTFSKVLYQTTVAGASARTTYSHDVPSGKDAALSFQPIPEKCRWSNLSAVILYCASPLAYVPANYLDLWHQGTASAADGIFGFNTATGATLLIASPGGQDGGVQADIAQVAVSPDERYLLYITKGDRSLWGVRLAQ